MEVNHNKVNIKCDNCPETFGNSEALVKHITQNHTRKQHQEKSIVKCLIDSQVNCLEWTCSFCGEGLKGKEGRDKHMCPENPFQTVHRPKNKERNTNSQELCRRGANCHHWKTGTCWFMHVTNVEKCETPQGSSRSTSRESRWCAYQERCDRRLLCPFKHMDSERDFLQKVQGKEM